MKELSSSASLDHQQITFRMSLLSRAVGSITKGSDQPPTGPSNPGNRRQSGGGQGGNRASPYAVSTPLESLKHGLELSDNRYSAITLVERSQRLRGTREEGGGGQGKQITFLTPKQSTRY